MPPSLFRLQSIRTKLLLFAAAVLIVPTIVYGVLTYAVARRALEPSLREELADDASTVKIAVQELLSGHVQNVATWARLDLMREMVIGDLDKTISRFLEGIKQDYGVYLDLLAIDNDGVCRAASSPEQIGTPTGQAVLPAVGAGRVGVPTVEYSVPRETFYIALTAPIPDPDHAGKRLGTLLAMLDLDSLRDVVRAKVGHHTVRLRLIDGQGRLLAGPGELPQRKHIPTWPLHTSERPPYRAGRRPVLFNITSPSTGELMVAETGLDPYRSLPDLAWSVVAAIPTDIALAPVRHVRNRVLLFGSAVTAAGLLLAWLLSNNIARPINRLTHITGRIADHGTLEEIPNPRSHDEVGDLTRSFQKMMRNVAAAQEEVVQSAKLAFLGEMSAGIAHEIRTPLGIIKNSAQLIERRVSAAGDEEGVEFARFIQEESDRLNGVVTGLLDFARPAPLATQPTDVNKVVRKAVKFLKTQASSRQVALRTDLSPRIQPVPCDGRQIYQVCLNLILNAVQACSAGGKVRITTNGLADGVEIVVRDDGSGIAEEVREHLFTPFATSRKGGIGLGLAIVERIISAHHGEISACNRQEGGAQFRVYLPAAQGPEKGVEA